MCTRRLPTLFLRFLVSFAIRIGPGHALSGIEQIVDFSQVSQPPTPSTLNSALTDIVETVANFERLPHGLQRAILWSAGWVQAIPRSGRPTDGSAHYVQAYVKCDGTMNMNSVLLSSSIFDDSTSCKLNEKCNNSAIVFTESTCDPSYVESRAACAVSPESQSWEFTLEQKNGPIWSKDSDINGSFDPQLFQFDGSDSNATIYLLAQTSSWIMDDNTCPNEVQFIAPCRQVSGSEVSEHTWCEPEIEDTLRAMVQTLKSTFPDTGNDESPDGLTIVAITTMCIFLLCIITLGFIAIRRLRFRADQGQTGLWDDDIITANRLPREKVRILTLISHGAFGEVYAGIYNNEQVAVKMLLPSTRRDMKLVNGFLIEAKLTATMDHPRIVTFIGIAWDSLSDLCVVMEFMEGGDLRTLLTNYKQKQHPVGFDREKVTIALHVCHALTYLHSLEPPLIHRDLKSRNILLNDMHEAKLTDFGISRERLDRTMTAGAGTSLWMAPEVMTGEHYDTKADIFSFGVVLSELDTHTLPYAQARQEMQLSHGRQMTDATLLQKVAMGNVTVEFSDVGPKSLTDLGCACISVDPTLRPSAAEVLFKLQVILSKELA
ncbi:TKL/MLK/MLK protein kinase [Phytophthora nicotianae INRA-310]|uniref:TKL/MLK/MLK protein kinase n=1 Tax=Phytophthora nicotianae (strain INRA-310) TaxID=761204 RepID=W2QAK4_PHYN3|nr:TKL/MLK/MLK protein kinase [Phytophthora nicotianae INRA-310]ETN09881.1 TKL/MLK/MLK protein kinase [Phytophthora nicotianae INRA-310]